MSKSDDTLPPLDDLPEVGAPPPPPPPPPRPKGDAPKPPPLAPTPPVAPPKASSLPEAARPVTEVPRSTEEPTTSAVGTTLNDNYRVDRLIGAGGMGEVYEGEHLFTGNRVAIKMILQELSKDEAIVGLFRREARILFDLADDAIVRYLDSFYHKGTDRYCLVMQFIDGIPLADRLEEKGPLPLGQVTALMRRLSLGLDKAHKMGVTHRDLSPDNVMLREGSVEKAAIIDFGIATAEDMSEATLFGRFAGKYKYVAPEQLGLYKGEVGPWTDIYGLALLIACACRGTGLDMGRSFPEAVQAREQVPDLSSMPDRLRPLLARMLEPDPKDRPTSMAEVAAMLDDPALLARAPAADQTVIAMPPGSAPRSAPPQGGAARIASPPGADLTGGQGVTGRPTTTGLGKPVSARPVTEDGPFRLTEPPAEVTAAAAAAPRRRSLWPPLLVGLALAGAAGAWVVTQRPDLMPGASVETPAEPAATGEEEGLTPQSAQASAFDVPPPDTSTREGYLAAFGMEETCTYATRITAGADVGRIARFAPGGGALSGLADAYGETFGVAPGMVERSVTEAQCPVLDLLRAVQGRAAVAPTLVLDATETQVGGTVLGRVGDVRGRGLWLVLVTAAGQIFDLSSRLEAQPDGSFLFAFQLNAANVSGAEPQLLLAVASPDPLVAAATAVDGAVAEEVVPGLLRQAVDAGAAAQAAQFLLLP